MTGYGAVLAAGLALFAVAGLADLVLGAARPRLMPVPYLTGAAASACLAVAGAAALAGQPVTLTGSGLLGPGTVAPAADPLAGLFLVIAFGAAVPVSLALASWAPTAPAARRRGLAASYGLVLGAVGVVIIARDVFTFLFAWEAVTLAFYLQAGFQRARPGRPAAALITLAFGQVSGALLLAGFLLLAGRSGTLALAGLAQVPGGALRSTAQVLLLAGFAVKVGLIPFQVWLPRGYAAAPGPIRAIMAGVAVNTGFYGLWRVLALLGPPPQAITSVLLILAGLTAVLGIAHAAVQTSLQRVIAYSSVENSGLILAGFGVALTGAAVNTGFYGLWRALALLGPPPQAVTSVLLILAGLTAVLGIAHAAVQTSLQRVIAYSSVENSGLILAGFGVALTGAAVRSTGLLAAGMLAATLQIVAHTAAKSLLFTSSARLQAADGSDSLDQLRGTVRSRPWSGTGLAIGSLTLAGLPPTVGFVSEWFLLEALMQQFRIPGLADRLVLAVTGAAVALTAGFAGVAFVRLVGMIVLGRPSPGLSQGRDYGAGGRAGVVILAAACLVTAALTPLEIRVIAAGLAPVVPAAATMGALKSPLVLQPVFAAFSILSPSWLWIMMPALFAATALGAWVLSGQRLLRVRRVPPWLSATAGVSGPDSYTAFGFANPTRRVLISVLHTRAETRELTGHPPEGVTGEPDPPAETARPAPASRIPEKSGTAAHIGYRSDVIEVVEQYLYRPLLRPFQLLVRAAQRLQSGRLDAYLAYMLLALIAVLAVVTAVS